MTLSDQRAKPLSSFIQQTEDYLDQVVEHGNDQELFIASYLQGHFAVTAGQSQVQNMSQVAQLGELMDASLTKAFENNELIYEDQKQVESLWQTLLTGVK